MQKKWCQANHHQCPNCRPVPYSQTLCGKCGKDCRINHNMATCGVCDATAHLKCTALSHESEITSETRSTIMELSQPTSNDDRAEFRPTVSTPPASNEEFHDTCHIPEPTHLHLFGVPHSDQEIKSESNLYHLWSIQTSGQHQSAKTRESIRDGCREWRCSDTAKSPSMSTIPSRNLPTPIEISESTLSQEVQIIHLKTQEDGVNTQQIPQKKYEATNRLLEGAPCSACTTRIRQGAQRLACWSCKAQYHHNCMMSYRTQTTQTWQCSHCSQKPVADSLDNQMTTVLYKKSPGVHQYQHNIFQ